MNEIETLKNMINDAKARNDDVLVEYLNKALEHIMEKQKLQEDVKSKSQENTNQEQNIIQEEKKEVIIEQKNEKEESRIKDDDIKRVQTGEVSRLTTTNTNNHILESKYETIRSNAKNSSLRTELNSVLITLALDDITHEQKATMELLSILKTYNKPEDIQDILNFLDDISKISSVGLTAKQNIMDAINNKENTEENNKNLSNYFDDEYEKLNKRITFADVEYDEINNKPTKDTNDYEEMLERYQKILHDLEKLYDETYGKTDSKKIQNLDNAIKYIKQQIARIQNFQKQMKDIESYVESSFNF